jgi:hypothetical protein
VRGPGRSGPLSRRQRPVVPDAAARAPAGGGRRRFLGDPRHGGVGGHYARVRIGRRLRAGSPACSTHAKRQLTPPWDQPRTEHRRFGRVGVCGPSSALMRARSSMRREPRSRWRRGAGRHRGSPSWLHAQPRSVTEGVGNRGAMSDSRVLERATGRLPRHPIGAVCPASHARDREHSIHRFVERVSAERRLGARTH